MLLSKSKIDEINPALNLQYPSKNSFNLPEKVLQFGTGVLLRGLPDYFIDKANRNNVFNGRVVMVKSTNHGNINNLRKQDNLYTICVRGFENDREVEDYYLNSSVSRILTAKDQWDEVLACAANTDLEFVFSNTTEVGIQLIDDDIHANPPESFPGKLLSFLFERYKVFSGDEEKGLVIIPTELIIDNADKLKEILVELSHKNNLDEEFIQWLLNSNTFCNSLVDRIVPGKPDKNHRKEIESCLGYEDNFLIEAEPYRLWAIEVPNQEIKEKLTFAETDSGVILAKDITKYRTLKLRLLNGTHTFTCALAYLSGFETVSAAMSDEKMGDFIQELMDEIIHTIVEGDISLNEARTFANSVADRFRNPFIVHKWLSISTQYTSKVKMRNVPLLLNYNKKFNDVPPAMAKGLGAYILFMRSKKMSDGTFYSLFKDKEYVITDDYADVLYAWWQKYPENPVKAILSDVSIWGTDLTQINGLVKEVREYVFDCSKVFC